MGESGAGGGHRDPLDAGAAGWVDEDEVPEGGPADGVRDRHPLGDPCGGAADAVHGGGVERVLRVRGGPEALLLEREGDQVPGHGAGRRRAGPGDLPR
ncbi:MAG: hypothetical protein EDQ89_02950, partial [Acidobacteria bacterium]